MTNIQGLINLILKAVAVGMAVAAIVLGYLGTVDVNTQVNLLAFGLFALSVAALQKESPTEAAEEKPMGAGEVS